MQIASRQPVWREGGRGTVIEVEMTPATGLTYRVCYRSAAGKDMSVEWGDGTKTVRPHAEGDLTCEHRYAAYGRYAIVLFGVKSVGLRFLEGQTQDGCDAAVLSVVDYEGQITSSQSAAFKRAVNLERFICPNCTWQGQRDFAYCTKLKEVKIGRNTICYDGTYQFCTSLVRYAAKSTNTCWSYVWQGCARLRELRLGAVNQLSTNDFDQCPSLTDIWIDNKTVEQIKQVAGAGNIKSGYKAGFPWGASPGCRFHGTNGIVLGDGTIIHG